MNYLALDASTEACSVALTLNGETFSRYDLCPQSHSLQLLPMVDAVLKEAGITLNDLDGLIFGRGPGSFTGVRIGVGVAQGLAFSANLPVVGVSSLQAMAQSAYLEHKQTEVLALIDARMNEVYNGYFKLDANGIMQPETLFKADTETKKDDSATLLYEFVTPPGQVKSQFEAQSLAAVYGVGTGWDAYEDTLNSLKVNQGSPQVLFPNAVAMLAIGHNLFEQGAGVSAENAQPVYVRDTVSWKKLPGKS